MRGLYVGVRYGLPTALGAAPIHQSVLLRTEDLSRGRGRRAARPRAADSRCRIVGVDLPAGVVSRRGNRSRARMNCGRKRKRGRKSGHQGDFQVPEHIGAVLGKNICSQFLQKREKRGHPRRRLRLPSRNLTETFLPELRHYRLPETSQQLPEGELNHGGNAR